MERWLRLARGIDALNRTVARTAQWSLPANAMLVAGNAVARQFFSTWAGR